MSGEWQVEMLWRCTACQNKNLGRHAQCQRCGKPKTGAEEYEMPSDTSEANAVHDEGALRLATAGANWRCRYCGSDQRRFDGACGQCGASQAEGKDLGAAPAPTASAPAELATGVSRSRGLVWAVLVIPVLFVIFFLFRKSAPPPPLFHDLPAAVASLSWEQAVEVERYKLVDREGFAADKPADAVDPHPAGQHVHHVDKVPDGFTSETYTETVSDGYRTETYTESERCGESCTPRPQSCSQSCTPNKNGFATCRQVCSGGGQSCSPKYCSVSKTRQVPQTKQLTKTRQVPKYKEVPRYADWATWKAWAWTKDRVVKENGDTPETRWPTPEAVKLGVGLATGEQEREHRTVRYDVQIRTDDGKSFDLHPASPEELQRFAAGSRHVMRVSRDGHLIEVDPVGDGGTARP